MEKIPELGDGQQTVYFKSAHEWSFLRTPTSFSTTGPTVPLVVLCHGNSGSVSKDSYVVSTTDTLDDDQKSIFVGTLVRAGIAVAGSNAHGSAWGRPDSVFAYAALIDMLIKQVNINPGKIGMLGGGLGGTALWNAITGPLAGKIGAVALQQATLNFTSVIKRKKFKGNLLTAWGIPEDADDDLAIASLAQEDPLHRARLLTSQATDTNSHIPRIGFFHGDQDENMDYGENVIALANILKSLGIDYSMYTYEGVGHATYALGKPVAEDITNFFLAVFDPSR